jgi:hypothetical protein
MSSRTRADLAALQEQRMEGLPLERFLAPPFIGRSICRDRRATLSLARIFRLGLYVTDLRSESAMVFPVAGLWIFRAG